MNRERHYSRSFPLLFPSQRWSHLASHRSGLDLHNNTGIFRKKDFFGCEATVKRSMHSFPINEQVFAWRATGGSVHEMFFCSDIWGRLYHTHCTGVQSYRMDPLPLIRVRCSKLHRDTVGVNSDRGLTTAHSPNLLTCRPILYLWRCFTPLHTGGSALSMN